MFAKRTVLIVLFVCAVVLALGIGLQSTGTALALTQARVANPTVMTIPYTGRLANDVGKPAADGAYDFTFTLYDAETGGTRLWTETQSGVKVTAGDFVTALGSVNPIPAAALEGGRRWLAVEVRAPGARESAVLTPRQQLNTGASAPQAAPAAAAACPHNHMGETWTGTTAFSVVNSTTADPSIGIRGLTESTSNLASGVYGLADSSQGYAIGVWGQGKAHDGYGGKFENLAGGVSLDVWGNGGGAYDSALRVDNTNTSTGIAAYLTNRSGYSTTNMTNSGVGEVLYLQSSGGDFIRGVNASLATEFRIKYDGTMVFLGPLMTPAADFAEMLPSVEGLQAGDVLTIDSDGKLTRSTEAYQSTVVGVYSTKPGFVGGQPVEGKSEGTIPLAVMGIVPVKVSAENGAIRPGDLLVASATSGHAMKAGANPPQGTIIGKAIEKLDAGTGVIKMLATLQ